MICKRIHVIHFMALKDSIANKQHTVLLGFISLRLYHKFTLHFISI